jgi:hypothetical protein
MVSVLAATSAHARFGKRSEPEESKEEHKATSANESSSSSSSGTHSASSAAPSTTSQASKSWFYGFARPRSCGYWSGAYVPWYGYGYRTFQDEQVVGSTTPPALESEEPGMRLVAGIESQFFGNGFNLGANVGVEFGPVTLAVSGANITVRADDGTNGWDNLQQVAARVGFTVLTGKRGVWKAEAGADAIFAPDLVVVGPTVGTSGSVWLVGPLAAEGSGYWTFYPYDQVDLRLGAAVGFGPLGLRAGWRFQLLSDRGLVDGVVHTDIFTGPYTGLSLAL